MGLICNDCWHKDTCKEEKITCTALQELFDIHKARNLKDRAVLTRLLGRKLGIRDAEPSKELQLLAESVIGRFDEFGFIKEFGVRIGYVISYENKCGQKATYADCRKLNEVYKAFLPFDFIVTFYYFNTEILSENQKKILMLHELKHITITERGLSVKPHDIEDFKDILDKYGNEWNEFQKDVPDILAKEAI